MLGGYKNIDWDFFIVIKKDITFALRSFEISVLPQLAIENNLFSYSREQIGKTQL